MSDQEPNEIAKLRADLARVTAERDARPEISREDAKILHMLVGDYADQWDTEGALRQLRSALRAHADGSGKGGG